MKKFITISLLLLILITAVAGYWYYRGRMFSKEVLKLEILGPQTVKVGEEVDYTLRYKNNGDFTLENASLTFEFPEYSISQEGPRRTTLELDDIYPGQERTENFQARILGKEGDLKVAEAQLSYTPKNLQARYESKTTFTTEIDFVPLTLEFDLPSRIESEKEVRFPLNYFSNLDFPLDDVEIEIRYPEGFDFSESEPQGIEDTVWKISVLERAQGGRKTIKGILEGEEGDKKEFEARLGIWQDGEFVLLKETTREIEITKPSLHITQEVNGKSDYIASPGEKLKFDIYFKNTSRAPFENEFLMIRLEGDALDLETLKADMGEAQPGDNLISWSWRQIPELRYLDSGEEGKVGFEVKLKEEWDVAEEDLGETIVKNEISISQIHRKLETKVNSKLEIDQMVYYENEFFDNESVIPPEVGEETNYLVIWNASNYYNDAENVKVRAVLPENVYLTGEIYPEEKSPKFSYDSQSRELVWMVSENAVEAGTGVLADPESIAFQIAFIPDENQRGEVVKLLSEVRIEGEDQWTKNKLESKGEEIRTDSLHEEINQEGKVQ